MRPSFISVACASALLRVAFACPLTSNITTSGGPIYGNALGGNGVLSFKDIPYAQPPIGSLHWDSPRPPPSWKETCECYEVQNIVLEFLGWAQPSSPGSEDCLTANI